MKRARSELRTRRVEEGRKERRRTLVSSHSLVLNSIDRRRSSVDVHSGVVTLGHESGELEGAERNRRQFSCSESREEGIRTHRSASRSTVSIRNDGDFRQVVRPRGRVASG